MKKANIHVRINEDVRDEFYKIAESRAQVPSSLIRLWIDKYIKENKN